MKEYTVDCAMFNSPGEAHEYLMQALCLPEYYGKNLDALYDCLFEIPPCRIILENQSSALTLLGEYGKRLLDTLLEGIAENPDIELLVKQ